MFTDSIIESLAIKTQTNFTWHNISGLEKPRLVADVLILPIVSLLRTFLDGDLRVQGSVTDMAGLERFRGRAATFT